MTITSRRVLDRVGLLVVGIALGLALWAPTAGATLQQSARSPLAWTPPPGVVQVSECVPTMGEHWANPDDLPMGPIYTVYNGNLMSIEYMPSQAEFVLGKSWQDLTFHYLGQRLEIDHANIDFQPHGHEGFEVPHYDMHFYLVTYAEERAITC